MAGLLSLIFGAVLGGSAISAARENARLRSKPYKHLDFPNHLFTAFHNIGNAHYQRHFPHDVHGDGESRWARESSPLGIRFHLDKRGFRGGCAFPCFETSRKM